MKPDTFTNTPEDAAAYERIRGRDEATDPDGFVETRTPFCSICQRGTKAYVCGPCERQWPVLWTCPRCEADHRFDTPADGCGCGYIEESA